MKNAECNWLDAQGHSILKLRMIADKTSSPALAPLAKRGWSNGLPNV
jgi:hypothetical protein